MSLALLPLLLACGGPPESQEAPTPAVDAYVAQRRVASGETLEVVTRTWVVDGWQVEEPLVVAEGLEAGAASELEPVRDGSRWLRERHVPLAGPDGSYIVAFTPVTMTSPEGGEEVVELPPIFVDIGVSGPSGGELAELELAPEPRPFPWALVAGLGALVLLVLLGLWAWLRRRRGAMQGEAPLSPLELAQRSWTAARGARLSDHALAVELSRVFREYLELTSGWPATRRTGPEILRWLEAEGRWAVAERVRAARLLNATDRLKFAREGGGADFFERMDADFEALLAADTARARHLDEAAGTEPSDATPEGVGDA